MKNIFRFLFLICALLILATSCKNNTTAPVAPTPAPTEQSGIRIVANNAPDDAIQAVCDAVFDRTGKTVSLGKDESTPYENEIIIGESTRDVSLKCYLYLSRITKNEENTYAFLIYSDGRSIAIAYEKDIYGSNAALYCAIESFVDYLASAPVVFGNAGTICQGEIDPIKWQKEKDDKQREEAWNKLSQNIGGSLGEAVVNASKQYYSLITEDIIEWMADLYDPETGGFYYSNSGRNTIGYGTDIESTYQVLEFLMETGVLDAVGGSPAGLPEEMRESLVNWIKPMQNTNGYFYHPQWTKESVDRQLSRRGRDLKYAELILAWCSASPTYDTPNGIKGDMTYADGTPVPGEEESTLSAVNKLTKRLADPTVSAVYAVLTSKVTMTGELGFLTDAASFQKYLDTLNIKGDAYAVGNELSSQAGQIKYRDEQLKKLGKDSIISVLEAWLNKNQNTTSGTWYFVEPTNSKYSIYSDINGLLKISSLYNAVGIKMNHTDEAIATAIRGINSSEPINTACHAYNPWFAVNNIFENIKSFSDGKSAEQKINSIRASLLAEAPLSIKITMEKVLTLQKADGTFSYFPDSTSDTSQGMSVAVPNTNEGDVNSTIICAQRIPEMIFTALGYDTPKAFGVSEWYLFYGMINNLGPVIKDIFVERRDPITFDEDIVGAESNDIKVITASQGSFVIEEDPRESKNGNVFAFRSVAGGTDNLYAYCEINSVAPCYIFESEMCINAESSGYIASISLDECYMIGLRVAGGRVHFLDSSSSNQPRVDIELGSSVALGEWFNLKIEYYFGSHDTVRAKMYVNNVLVSVSDNYYDKDGEKISLGTGIPSSTFNYARIIAFKNANISILLDDIVVRKSNKTYTRANDPNNQPIYNIDPPDKEKIVYDFEDIAVGESYPDDFEVTDGNGAASVILNSSNKLLSVSGTKTQAPKIYIPVNVRTKHATAYVFDADINIKDFENGELFDIAFCDNAKTKIISVRAVAKDGAIYICDSVNGITGRSILTLPASGSIKFRAEYFPANEATVFYLNGEALAFSDIVSSQATGLTVSQLEISALKASAFTLELDNITVEYSEIAYDSIVAPQNGKLYDFENQKEGVTLSQNTEIKEYLGNKYLSMSSGSSVSLDYTSLTKLENLSVTEFGFSIPQNVSNAKLGLNITDAVGNLILAFDFISDGKTTSVYEKTEANAYPSPLASFEANATANVRIEYYSSHKEAVIYVNSVAVAVTGMLYNESAAYALPSKLIITSGDDSKFNLDNLKFEGYNKKYESVILNDAQNGEDEENFLDFESSSTGKLPSNLEFISTIEKLRIEETRLNGSVTKALSFRTQAGSYDKLFFSLGEKYSYPEEYNAAIFETDLIISNESTATPTYEIYLGNSEGANAYLLTLRVSGGKIQIRDISGTSDDEVPGRILGTWVTTSAVENEAFNLRIEYIFGNADTVKIITYVNGKKALVSDNFYGKSTLDKAKTPSYSIDRVGICAYKAASALMMLDNMLIAYDTVEIPEDKKTYDFENGLIPDEYFTLNDTTSGVNATVDIIKDTDAKNGTNVIKYSSNASSVAPNLTVFNCYEEKGANVYVFECDIKCDFGDKNFFYIDLLNGTKKVYTLAFKKVTDGIAFYDMATGSSAEAAAPYGTAKLANEWFNLKIEYYSEGGDASNLRFKTYINGELCYVSDNYFTSSSSYLGSIDNVCIRCYKNSSTVIYLDNMGLYRIVKENENDELGARATN